MEGVTAVRQVSGQLIGADATGYDATFLAGPPPMPAIFRRIALCVCLVSATSAIYVMASSSTLRLSPAGDTTIRGGPYAATNYDADGLLVTRGSSTPEFVRRSLL